MTDLNQDTAVAPPETLDLGNGIKLTPVNPTAAAIYGVIRTLAASAAIIVVMWRYVAVGNIMGLYQFIIAPTNAAAVTSVAVTLAGAGSLAWGAWKKAKGKQTENTLKTTVVAQHATIQAVADQTGTTLAGLAAAMKAPPGPGVEAITSAAASAPNGSA